MIPLRTILRPTPRRAAFSERTIKLAFAVFVVLCVLDVVGSVLHILGVIP